MNTNLVVVKTNERIHSFTLKWPLHIFGKTRRARTQFSNTFDQPSRYVHSYWWQITNLKRMRLQIYIHVFTRRESLANLKISWSSVKFSKKLSENTNSHKNQTAKNPLEFLKSSRLRFENATQSRNLTRRPIGHQVTFNRARYDKSTCVD